jgi:hypothetical protein
MSTVQRVKRELIGCILIKKNILFSGSVAVTQQIRNITGKAIIKQTCHIYYFSISAKKVVSLYFVEACSFFCL